MVKFSAKRLLLAAATASTLAAVMAPQVASADQVRCYGREECETRPLRVGRDQTVYYHATARDRDGDRARGEYEVTNARNGYRVRDGRFYGSTSGRAYVRPYNAYQMKVESGRRSRVSAHLWS